MTGVHICLENYKIFLFFFVQCIPKTVQLVKKNRLEPALSHLSHIYFLILEFSNIFQELILHFLFPSDHYQPDFTLAWEIHFQFAIFCIRKISIMEVKQVSSKLNRVNAVRVWFLQEMFQKQVGLSRATLEFQVKVFILITVKSQVRVLNRLNLYWISSWSRKLPITFQTPSRLLSDTDTIQALFRPS